MSDGSTGDGDGAGPRVVLACDALRGWSSAAEAVDRLASGLAASRPDVQVQRCPVADGGAGTLEAAIAAGFTRVPVRATGLDGRPVESAIGVRDGMALVELVQTRPPVRQGEVRPDPWGAGSRGVGDLVRAALDAGCHRIVLAVGGSGSADGGVGSADGGAGMLQALGASLVDADGIEVAPGGGGLTQLSRVDLTTLDPRLADTRIVLAGDADNPLLGPDGVAAVCGPRMGASASDVRLLDKALARWADLVDASSATLPAAGAAGGLGFAAMTVLGARVRPGVEAVLDLVGIRELIEGADLVVTGGGGPEDGAMPGTAVAGVAAVARAFGVPAVAVFGRRDLDDTEVTRLGLRSVYVLSEVERDVGTNRAEAGTDVSLEAVGRRIAVDCLP